MGTPEFAIPSLDILLKNKYDVIAVITAPDKPAGRGKQMSESAIKKYALANQIPILQPEKLKDPNFIEQLISLRADLQIVVAFRMLPQIVWSMPPLGTFNLHGSLLPQYRGAAPINWAIINGEKETGVSTFFLQQEIDTGNIIFQSTTPIEAEDNAGTIHDKLMELGADLVLKTVQSIENKTITESPQSEIGIEKTAPKIFKEDCEIDWNNDAEKIQNKIRGLSPFPTAFAKLNGQNLKIFKAQIATDLPSLEPGQFSIEKTILVGTKTHPLELLEIQLEGKKRMMVKDFLLGYREK
jgi:methionyl-tRNA formyltransferase